MEASKRAAGQRDLYVSPATTAHGSSSLEFPLPPLPLPLALDLDDSPLLGLAHDAAWWRDGDTADNAGWAEPGAFASVHVDFAAGEEAKAFDAPPQATPQPPLPPPPPPSSPLPLHLQEPEQPQEHELEHHSLLLPSSPLPRLTPLPSPPAAASNGASPLVEFECDPARDVGFVRGWVVNVARRAFSQPQRRCALGKPAVRGELVAVGAEGEDERVRAAALVLARVDESTGLGFACSAQLETPVSEVAWLGPNALVAAEVSGARFTVLRMESTERSLRASSHLASGHRLSVRELCCDDARLCSASNDGTVRVFDCAQGALLAATAPLGAAAGSVRCSESLLSCTVDNGALLLFDLRAGLRREATRVASGKGALYTHAPLTPLQAPHHVLLGFGDGELRVVDVRQPTRGSVEALDPYVAAVGHIDLCAASRSFVASGQGDLSVWRLRGGVARVASHSTLLDRGPRGEGDASCAAVFATPTLVLSADSEGALWLFEQEAQA